MTVIRQDANLRYLKLFFQRDSEPVLNKRLACHIVKHVCMTLRIKNQMMR